MIPAYIALERIDVDITCLSSSAVARGLQRAGRIAVRSKDQAWLDLTPLGNFWRDATTTSLAWVRSRSAWLLERL
jgi:hypothetical protein